MSIKDNKILSNKWFRIFGGIILYVILLCLVPRVTGWLTIIGVISLGVYLSFKSEKFKQRNKFVKSIVVIGLLFVALIGGAFTTMTPESIEQSRLASEKAKIEKQEKQAAEQKSKEEQAKKEAEEKAKAEEAKKAEENKKAEEAKAAQASSTTVSGELKIHFINVGQADSILVQQGNQNMLIDAGNNGDSQTIKSYLDSQGVKELQYFVGTHAHEDHIGSADYILNSFKVGKVYFPKQQANSKTYTDFISAAKAKVGALTAPNVGETFKLGEATCTILAPNSDSYEDPNDYSIVIKVQFGDNKFLLTGDAQATSEMEMVKKGLDLKADLLKVGHHGSKTSTSANFLSAVSPKFAVVSVGKGNTYGHPAQGTMDRLKSAGVNVYRTDENGTIVATSNGKEISFNCKPGSYSGIASSSNTSSGNTSSSTSSSTSSNTNNAATSNSTSSTSGSTGTSTSGSNQTTAPQTPSAPPAQQTGNDSLAVWIASKSGAVYHDSPNCSNMKSPIQITLKEARDRHLKPCSKCHPPQ